MSDHVGDDPTPHAGSGSYRKTPTQLASDPAFTGTYAGVVAIAAPTGTTDDTALFTAAEAKLPTNGGILWLGPGVFKLPTGYAFTKRVSLVGQGAGRYEDSPTRIEVSSATANGLSFAAAASQVRDLAIVNTSGAATAGAGLYFTAGNWSRIDRVLVNAFWNNVAYDQGYYYTIADSAILNPVNYGFYLRNTASGEGDHGDQTIEGCTITKYGDTTASSGTAVRWQSGGGLRFVNNKINGATQPGYTSTGKWNNGIVVSMDDGISTSVLVVAGNSIENFTSSGIQLTQSGTTGVFAKANITGNEFLGSAASVAVVARIPNLVASFGTVLVSDNVFTGCAGSISLGNLGTVLVGPNVHQGVTTYAVNVFTGMTVTDLRVAEQVLNGTNLSLYVENTAGLTSAVGPFSQATWLLERELGTITSNSAWTNLYQIAVPDYGAGKISLTVFGNLTGVGAAVYTVDAVYTKGAGGNPTVTAGTATTAGGVFDVQFDASSVTGNIIVAVKRNTTNGTSLSGRVSARVTGALSQIKKV